MSIFTEDDGALNLELDKISPSKVHYNELDPVLNSVLQVLAENREVYEKIFLNYEPKHGIYALHLFKNGKPQVVVIDDFILTGNEMPITNEDSDLSVSLIEKARAKLMGTYHDLLNLKQTSQQIFRELTGKLTECHDVASSSFDLIKNAKE